MVGFFVLFCDFKMRKQLTFLLLFIYSFGSYAQTTNSYEEFINKIEKTILSFDAKKSLSLIDSVLVKDVSKKNIKQSNTLKALKVEALTIANLFEESLQLSKELLKSNDITIEQRTRILINNALAYEYVGNFKACKEKLDELTELFNSNTAKKDEFYGEYLYRYSSFYRVQGKDEKAKEYAEKSYEFGTKNNYVDVQAVSSMLLGFLSSNTKESQEYYKRCLQYWKKLGDKNGSSSMFLALAKIERDKKDYKKQLAYADSAIVVVNKSIYYEALALAYEIKSDALESLNAHDSAIVSLRKSYSFSEKNTIYKQQIKVNEQLFNYKLEQRKHDLEDLKKHSLWLVLGLIGTLIATGVILFFLIRINFKNKKIKEQTREISTQLEEKKVLLKELHHRVKNNLSMMLSLINIQASKAKNTSEEQLYKDMEERVQTVAIAHNQFLVNDEKELFSAEKYVATIVNKLVSLSPKAIKKEIDVKDFLVNLDTALPIGIIINELITNSLKHSSNNEVLDINLNLYKENNTIFLNYKDNGNITEEKPKENVGLFLIDTMAKQLRGSYTNEKFHYKFQLKNK